MKRMVYICSIIVCCTVLCSCSENEERRLDNNVEPDVEVMSFNIRYSGGDTGEHSWENRKAACLSVIQINNPDLIGMQEVRPDQKAWFDSNLSEYRSIGLPRDASGLNAESTNIYYRTDKFTLLDSCTFWLSETPDVMSKGWDGACFRVCTWCKLRLNDTGKEIFFFNTHIDHKGEEAKNQGILLVQKKINEIAGENACVFLTGDFNLEPANSNIIAFGKFMDCAREQFPDGSQINMGTYNNWGSASTIIDYIWYRNSLPAYYKVVKGKYEGVYYFSDHFPIMAGFALN